MTIPKFVRCIKASNGNGFLLNQIYEVIGLDTTADTYFFKDVEWWNEVNWFVPVKGKVVKCLDTSGVMSPVLFIGALYEVMQEIKDSADNDSLYYKIYTCKSDITYRASRFETIYDPDSALPATLRSGQISVKKPASSDPDEEKCWAIFRQPRNSNECKCGAPLPCSYHS